MVLDVPTGSVHGDARAAARVERRADRACRRSTIPSRALIGTGFPFKHRTTSTRTCAVRRAHARDVAGVRRAGAAALDLADVACGRFDGFWELKLAPWDIAAGILLVREAGGVVTDLGGAPADVDAHVARRRQSGDARLAAGDRSRR